MVRALRLLTRAVCTHRSWFVWPQVVLFGLCVWFTAAKLEFHTNRNDLVGADKKYHQNFLRFKKEFPAQDDLVVVVESESIARNRQFVERLGAKLELETNLFIDVFYKGSAETSAGKTASRVVALVRSTTVVDASITPTRLSITLAALPPASTAKLTIVATCTADFCTTNAFTSSGFAANAAIAS